MSVPNMHASRLGHDRLFASMLLLALIVHGLGLLIASLIPPAPVATIPVRALSFKIGDAPADVPAAMPTPQPELPVATAEAPVADWATPPALLPPPPLQAPVRHVREAAAIVEKPVLPSPPAASEPSVPTAQRFVREEGTAPLDATDVFGDAPPNLPGTVTTPVAPSTAVPLGSDTIKDVYAKQIAEWIAKHKTMPATANPAAMKAIVRIRVDRAGYLRYYALEESSGDDAVDKAAIAMVRRANPVPAAPAGYPAGSLIEFLVPIVFK